MIDGRPVSVEVAMLRGDEPPHRHDRPRGVWSAKEGMTCEVLRGIIPKMVENEFGRSDDIGESYDRIN